MSEQENDDDTENDLRFIGWIPVKDACTMCGDDRVPAAIITTLHMHKGFPRCSVALQPCSSCLYSDVVDLEQWVRDNDPWDEVSAAVPLSAATDEEPPCVLATSMIEPRCTRCRMMAVAFLGVIERRSGRISVGGLANVCRACLDVVTGKTQGHDH